MSAKRSLAEIEKDLKTESQLLRVKTADSARAQREETECRNRLNALQKEMSFAYDELQRLAPPESDWGHITRRQEQQCG